MSFSILPTVVAGAVETVADVSALPATENSGAMRFVLSSSTAYIYDGAIWVALVDSGGAPPGDVSGPSSAMDNALVRFDGTDGKTVKNSSVTISDAAAVSGVSTLAVSGPITDSSLDVSTALVTNGAKAIVSSDTTAAEIGYVSGVTSAIQSQIDGKQATGSYITSLTGGVSASGPGAAVATVVTNANLTGDVTSVGNATAIAAGVIVDADINASAGIVDTKLATIATAGKVSNSATTAASANTASAIVARDGSGNFTAGTVTAALSGNATTATLAATVTTNANLTGDVTSVGNATTLTNAPVIAKVLTGYTSGAGTVSSSDSILQAIQKLNGNDATNANLTGPVTSVGNATAIADGAIALAKLATTTAGFIPVGAASTGVPTYVAVSGDATISSTGAVTLATVPVAKGGTAVTSVTTTPTATAFAGWDANKNLSAQSFLEGYATTATGAGTTTLTVASMEQQFFTGTSTQTVVLPVASTLVLGQRFRITNQSTGIVTIQSSGANTVQAMAGSTVAAVTCILVSGTTAASWSVQYSSLSGSGSGSGELNLIANPSDAGNWTRTGTTGAAGNDPATTTTAADLPLSAAVPTAIKLLSATSTGAEDTAYVSYAFTTPASLGAKLKVEFYMRPGSNFIASEWTVSVYQSTTRQALSTDSSSITYLPNASGKFTTTFDAVASTAYTLRFARTVNGGTNAAQLNLANVIVGPGIQPQGAALGPWTSYTPVITNNGSKVFTAAGKWRRHGDSMEVQMYASGDTSAAGAGASSLLASIPTGYTIDSSGLAAAVIPDDRNAVGFSQLYAIANANQWDTPGLVTPFSTTQVRFSRATTSGNYTTADINIARAVQIDAHFTVPIAEWAGSGTVNLAQNDVEYASNSSTSTTASDTTSFANGPAGSAIQSITAALNRRVRFRSPIQATDVVEVQLSADGVRWVSAGSVITSSANTSVGTLGYDGTDETGVGPRSSTDVAAATDIDIRFGTKRLSATTWASVATFFWRVKKSAAGQAVGFGLVNPGVSAGLVSASGLKGATNGVALGSGYVGEKLSLASGGAAAWTSTQYTDGGNTGLTLTPGVWLVKADIVHTVASDSAITQYIYGVLATTSGNSGPTDATGYIQFQPASHTPTSNQNFVSPWMYVNISASTVYYPKMRITGTRSSGTVTSNISAVRIA